MTSASKMPTPLPTKGCTENAEMDLQDRIRRRAYELYERRGRGDGHDRDDWLQAESEIKTPALAV